MSTATVGRRRDVEPWKRRLYLPAYSTRESARYADVHANTIRYWEYGREHVRPVVSDKERGKPLSYLQLVEIAFVATFRKLGVSLSKIRDARDYIAQTFESEYPFAEYRLRTEGIQVLLSLQQVAPGAGADRLIVASRAGQLGWESLIGARFAEFEYENGIALIWHVAGLDSAVSIDPRRSFGAPCVSGIPTWAIRGRWNAGASITDMAADFGVHEDEVVDALRFEGIATSTGGSTPS